MENLAAKNYDYSHNETGVYISYGCIETVNRYIYVEKNISFLTGFITGIVCATSLYVITETIIDKISK